MMTDCCGVTAPARPKMGDVRPSPQAALANALSVAIVQDFIFDPCFETRCTLGNRRPHKGKTPARAQFDHPTGDLSGIVDVPRRPEVVGEPGNEILEPVHAAVLPEDRPADAAAGHADDLPARIDAQRLTEVVSRQFAEILDASTSRPQERPHTVRVEVAVRWIREPDDVAARIDRHRRVPEVTAQVAEVDGNAILPQHRMGGTASSDRHVTLAGNTDDLASSVDGRGGGRRIARQRTQLPGQPLFGFPQDCAKLEHLRSVAGRIDYWSLGPADDLTETVDTCRESLV